MAHNQAIAMHYTTYFDVARNGYNWSSGAFCFLLVIFGLLMVFRPKLFEKRLPSGRVVKQGLVFRWFWLVSAAVIDVTVFAVTYSDYEKVQARMASGRFHVVEGRVENFEPLGAMGHGLESFSVGNVAFSYADGVETAGFHHTTAKGGPIQQGEYVRISYVGNEILKLEIADGR